MLGRTQQCLTGFAAQSGAQLATDNRLVRLAQRGNLGAFDALVYRHQDRVYRVALGVLHHAIDAEEATQETFLRAFRKLEQFRGDSLFTSWIHRIAYNTSLMKLRHKRVRPETSLDDMTLDGTEVAPLHATGLGRPPDASYACDQLGRAINNAIAALPPNYRLVITLYDVQQLPIRQVARRLSATVPGTKSLLRRARLKLRTALAPFAAS